MEERVNRPRNLIFAIFLGIFAASFSLPAAATTRYIAQTAGTFSGGTACNGQTAITTSTFNSTTLSAGDIAYVCGTITGSAGANGIIPKNGGSSASPIVINFDTGASLQAPYWGGNSFNGPTGAMIIGVNNVTINGGTNGLIENTLNGTSGGSCPGGSCGNQQASTGIYVSGSNVEIENVQIGPMYVHTQDDAGGSNVVGIFYANGTGGIVTNDNIHDAYDGFVSQYNGTNGVTSMQISNNTINHACHFMQIGDDNNGSTASGYAIYGNTMGPSQMDWVLAGQACHFDGIIMSAFNSGSVMSNTYIYNNVIQSDMCNGSDSNFNCTAWIFFTGDFNGMNIFNNVLVATQSGSNYESLIRPAPNSYSGATQSNINILNNTLVLNNGTGSGDDAGVKLDGTETNVVVENNIILHFSGSSTKAYLNEAGTFDSVFSKINYNDYYDTGTFGVNTPNSEHFTTYPQWKSSASSFAGYDINGSSGNPTLDANYKPQAGSAAIGLATNLTSLCSGSLAPLCTDAAGNPRPSSGNWDAGAYQSTTSSGPSGPAPPTDLSASVQ